MSNIIDLLVNKSIKVLSHYKDKRDRDSYIKGIRMSYLKLSDKKKLSKEQEEEIQMYYTNLLGHKIPLDWHQYFFARTGYYSKYYIPTSEYKTDIVGRLNVYPLKRAYTDKNVTDLILPMAHQPRIILKNMNGYFYIDGKAVTRQEAFEACRDLGDVILKPSLSSRGNGVRILHIENGMTNVNNKSLDDVFDEYISDYQIQELVRQHKDMSKLNPSSINTIRVLTYRMEMDIVILYSVIRIGRKGKDIDNESAGGISTIINKDGTLGRYAYGSPGFDKIEYTDVGVKLDGYKVPSYEKTLEKVKEYHLQLPFFKLMAWDIAIDEDGEPTLIEFNMTPDLSQSAYGPAFGDYTDIILKEAMSRNNTWSRVFESRMWKHNDNYKNKFYL